MSGTDYPKLLHSTVDVAPSSSEKVTDGLEAVDQRDEAVEGSSSMAVCAPDPRVEESSGGEAVAARYGAVEEEAVAEDSGKATQNGGDRDCDPQTRCARRFSHMADIGSESKGPVTKNMGRKTWNEPGSNRPFNRPNGKNESSSGVNSEDHERNAKVRPSTGSGPSAKNKIRSNTPSSSRTKAQKVTLVSMGDVTVAVSHPELLESMRSLPGQQCRPLSGCDVESDFSMEEDDF